MEAAIGTHAGNRQIENQTKLRLDEELREEVIELLNFVYPATGRVYPITSVSDDERETTSLQKFPQCAS
jgi:hypothetical protein